MVAIASSTKRNFRTLEKLLDEQKRMFKQFIDPLKGALAVNSEVIEYVREKCSSKYEILLTEMERDSKIYYSRFKHLKSKLDICSAYFYDTSKYYVYSSSRAERKAMYEKCLVHLIRFYDEKREILNNIKESQRKWLKTQECILASEPS